MNKILVTIVLCVCSLLAYGQSMKVVIDARGNVVGRYVATKANAYTIEVQETSDVPKAGKRVVTFSAAAGQGVVYRNQSRTGNIRVRKTPSTSAPIVALIPELDGVPETYPCLGKSGNWYKIKINGKVGYVRDDMACWDAMDTF